MSHASHAEHLESARAAGFRTRLIYVATEDPRVNLARVGERVDAGGHDVPPDKIVERYYKSIANLADAILVADEARIYDNSLFDEPFRQVAKWANGQIILLFDEIDLPQWFLLPLSTLQQRGIEIIEARPARPN